MADGTVTNSSSAFPNPSVGSTVGYNLITATSTVVRSNNTTGYTAGDVVSSSVTATVFMAFKLAASPGGAGEILKATINTSVKSIVPVYTLHLFTVPNASLAVAQPVDNLPNTSIYLNNPYYLGALTFAALTSGADTSNDTGSFTTLLLTVPFPFATLVPTPNTGVAGDVNIYGLLVDGTGVAAASGQSYQISLTARAY